VPRGIPSNESGKHVQSEWCYAFPEQREEAYKRAWLDAEGELTKLQVVARRVCDAWYEPGPVEPTM